ITYVLCDFKY
ncbi:hypothetical protein CDAR_486921, partial [Caerostris darwini]